ncbi:uncharacterized protein LOC131611013 isoform X2 [Vicia villosa]|nr:uncharacterized protein LOC131611013 isoform X2 [Vicia villosa]
MNTIIGEETKPPEEIEIPKESLSDCSSSGCPTSPVKKFKRVLGLGRIYDDSYKNTLFRVTNLSDSSKEDIVVCMNEHPNVLMMTTLTIFQGRQLAKRIKEELGITKLDIELCATSGKKPSRAVYAAYRILRRTQLPIELVTEVTVE